MVPLTGVISLPKSTVFWAIWGGRRSRVGLHGFFQRKPAVSAKFAFYSFLSVSTSTMFDTTFYPFHESFFMFLSFVLLCGRLPRVSRVPGGAHFSGVVVKSFLRWLKRSIRSSFVPQTNTNTPPFFIPLRLSRRFFRVPMARLFAFRKNNLTSAGGTTGLKAFTFQRLTIPSSSAPDLGQINGPAVGDHADVQLLAYGPGRLEG